MLLIIVVVLVVGAGTPHTNYKKHDAYINIITTMMQMQMPTHEANAQTRPNAQSTT